MSFNKDLNISDYWYNLPDSNIAKHPLNNRSNSKLLIYKDSKISHKRFSDIIDLIPRNKALFFNNTKVIQARLQFVKDTGAKIEIFCLEPLSPADYNLSFQQTEKVIWKCLVGNLKRWKANDITKEITINDDNFTLSAKKINQENNAFEIEFSWDNPKFTFSDIIEQIGSTPIPPYLNRKAEESDKINYQTVYSKIKGSVAAPTAGLHFTDDVLSKLSEKGVSINEVTLHVGAGTFKPVSTEKVSEHEMHAEHFVITKENINSIIANLDNIYAVGTTTVRTLESLYWIGIKIITNKITDIYNVELHQWDAYKLPNNILVLESLTAINTFIVNNNLQYLNASTQIMIAPPYKFRIINGLITNFHQPKSTLLLLISAFTGDNNWKDIYNYSMENNFRFLSYGDSSLLLP